MKLKEEIVSYSKALLVIQIILPVIVFTYVIGVVNIPADIVAVIVGLDCLMAVLSLLFLHRISSGESAQDRMEKQQEQRKTRGSVDESEKGKSRAAQAGGKSTEKKQIGGSNRREKQKAPESSQTEHGSSEETESRAKRGGDGSQSSRKKDRKGKRKRRAVGGKKEELHKQQSNEAGSRGEEKETDRESLSATVRRPENEAYQYKETGGTGTKFYAKETEMDESWPHKVLIVDDSLTTLKLLSAFLRKMHIGSSMARSGPEALEAVQRERFALIIIDHMMKGKDGLDTVKAIRQLKDDYYREVPVVDVLSVGMEQYDVQLNDEYYQAYLTKPIDYELLQQVMITYGLYSEE